MVLVASMEIQGLTDFPEALREPKKDVGVHLSMKAEKLLLSENSLFILLT